MNFFLCIQRITGNLCTVVCILQFNFAVIFFQVYTLQFVWLEKAYERIILWVKTIGICGFSWFFNAGFGAGLKLYCDAKLTW